MLCQSDPGLSCSILDCPFGQNPQNRNTAITIMVQVIHKNRRGGNSTKSLLDLTKKPTKASPPKPPVGAKPLLRISAAEDHAPIAADLAEQHRGLAPRVEKALTDQQTAVIDRIIARAGDGDRRSLGLRLVLAASEDECAGSWPIGLLSMAFSVAGHATASHAVYQVAQGCRTARFRDMAASALEVINKRIEQQK